MSAESDFLNKKNTRWQYIEDNWYISTITIFVLLVAWMIIEFNLR